MNSTRLRRFAVLLLALLPTLAQATPAGPGDAVHFAGVAFTGAAADAPDLLPVSSRLLGGEGLLQANAHLARTLTAAPPAHLDLRFGEQAVLDGTGSATAMAIALDREVTVTEHIGDQHKLLVELAAQLLFFDYRDMQVRLAFPVTVQRVDVLPQAPTAQDVEAAFQTLVHGDGPASLAQATRAALANLRLPASSALRMQLASVEVADGAQLPEGVLERQRSGTVGHEFTKLLSSTLGLGLLPHQGGQAVAGTMAARFADGRVFALKIPEPDYALTLVLEDFREKTLQQTPAIRQELLGAYFRVKAVEPLSGKVYLDHGFRHGATKTIPVTQATVDLDAARYETLVSGLAMFARAAQGDGRDWLRQQQDPSAAAKQAAAFQTLVEKCR